MYLVVCILTHITLHGGPEKWQKRGRAKWVLSHFCHVKERSCSFWNSTFKFQLFQEIFFLILPCLFTVQIRLVLSPCQAGNTCYTLTCFKTYSQLIVRYIQLFTHMIYCIILAPNYIRVHRILLNQ